MKPNLGGEELMYFCICTQQIYHIYISARKLIHKERTTSLHTRERNEIRSILRKEGEWLDLFLHALISYLGSFRLH